MIITAQILKKALPKNKLVFVANNGAILKNIIGQINNVGYPISPAPENIFRAFKITPLPIKAVIIGQDPYPNILDASGLAFSVPFGRPTPPSLRNIYKALLHCGIISKIPNHGCLEYWAAQGVLLLNTALTTVKGRSNAHSLLWRDFIRNIIEYIDEQYKPPFILWGNSAQQCEEYIKHSTILKWAHPSPLNKKNSSKDNKENFLYCDNFIKCAANIDWDINNGDLWVATDGAARKNGKKNCRASWAYVIDNPNEKKNGDVPKSPSNNRGELMAIINAGKRILELDKSNLIRINIITDSKYSIGTLPNYIIRANDGPSQNNNIKNLDLIGDLEEVFDKLNKKYKIFVYHLPAHKSAPSGEQDFFMWRLQDEADKFATGFFK